MARLVWINGENGYLVAFDEPFAGQASSTLPVDISRWHLRWKAASAIAADAVRDAIGWRLARCLRHVTANTARDAVHRRLVGAGVRVARLLLPSVVVVGLRHGRKCGHKCEGDRCETEFHRGLPSEG